MRIAGPYVDELTNEASTTRRVLERVPEVHLNWRPHEKSMSLGQLALPRRDAASPADRIRDRRCARLRRRGRCAADSLEPAGTPGRIRASTEQAQAYLAALSDERASATWRPMAGGRELFAAPRAAVLRSFLFNHWYHHRGQLLVYLRLLDVPVPSVYGPTAVRIRLRMRSALMPRSRS